MYRARRSTIEHQTNTSLCTAADEGGLGAVRFRSSIEVFHRDVVGWHRRADSSWQQLGYDDIVSRLSWDKETNANPIFDVRDIIAEEDRFALRFLYAADFVPTGGKIDVEMMYFYHLRGDKVAEFWLLASVDFDFTAKGTEGTHTR